MAKNSAAFNLIFGAKTNQLYKALNDTQRKLRRTSQQMSAVGKTMTRNLTLPLLAIGAGAFKTAMDFESSMSKVKGITKATDSEIKQLTNSARELGRSTTFTASQVAQLQFEYAKAGFGKDQILNATKATLNLAQATGSDLAQAAEVAGTTLNQFHLDAAETTRVTDVMTAAFSGSPLDITRFQESMKMVAPIAQKAGLSLEETTAMLMNLAQSGITGSMAGTQLNRIISELGSTSGGVTKAIQDLAEKGLNLANAEDEVGKRAKTALLVMGDGIPTIEKFTKELENSGGAASATAKDMNDNAKGGLKEMMSAIEGVAISIGTILTPAIEKLSDFIKVLAQGFESLSKPTQSIITTMAAAAAGAGVLLRVFGGLGNQMIKLVGIYKLKKTAVLADIVGTKTATAAQRTHAGAVAAGSLALKGFRTALISTGIGALVVALGFAAGKLIDYVTKINSAKKAETGFNTAITETNDALTERAKILDRDVENQSVKDLRKTTRAIQEEIDSLDAGDLINAMKKAGGVITGAGADVLNKTVRDANLAFMALLSGEDMASIINDFDGFIGGRGAELIETAVRRTRNVLIEQRKEAEAALEKLNKANNGTSTGGEDVATTSAAALRSEFVNLNNEIGFMKRQVAAGGLIDAEHLNDLESKLSKVVQLAKDLNVSFDDIKTPETLKALSVDVKDIFNSLDRSVQKTLTSTHENLKTGTNRFGELINAMRIRAEQMQTTFEAAFGIMSSSMQQMTSEGASGFESLAKSIGRAVRQIISAQIAQAVSLAILDALKKSGGNPFVGGMLAAAGATAAKGLFDSLITPFALGGIVQKPTLSLIGEAGPEAVVPFNRMDEFMNMAGAGASGGQVGVSGRITGNDIFLTNKYATNQSGRRRVII